MWWWLGERCRLRQSIPLIFTYLQLPFNVITLKTQFAPTRFFLGFFLGFFLLSLKKAKCEKSRVLTTHCTRYNGGISIVAHWQWWVDAPTRGMRGIRKAS